MPGLRSVAPLAAAVMIFAGCSTDNTESDVTDTRSPAEIAIEIIRGDEPDAFLRCDDLAENEDSYTGSLTIAKPKGLETVVDIEGTTFFTSEQFIVGDNDDDSFSVSFRFTSLEPGSGIEHIEPIATAVSINEPLYHTLENAYGNAVHYRFTVGSDTMTIKAMCERPN